MGKLRKIGKKIGRGIKKVGRKLKKGLGKIARAFGKLGPLGSIALSFILPGIGSWIGSMAGQTGTFLGTIATGIQNAAGFVGEGVSRVFTRVTDAIGTGMDKVGTLFGKKDIGTNFQNFVSDVTNGFVKPADVNAGVYADVTPGMYTPGPETNLGIGEIEVVASRGESFIDAAQARGERMFAPSDKPRLFSDENKLAVNEDGTRIKARDKIRGSQEYSSYKKILPVAKLGSTIVATEDAEKYAALQAKKDRAEYFSDVAQSNLMRSVDPNIGYIDFNNPNPSQNDLYMLQNAYTGILG
tara:strand:- start:3011 stop:3904 length:894 start_codon:yes stop_codon:yes gene_type:complete